MTIKERNEKVLRELKEKNAKIKAAKEEETNRRAQALAVAR